MSSKNKLIINCAATHVSAAEFGVSGGRLVLEDFRTQKLSYDYSVQEDWLPALRRGLRALKVSGKAAVIAPPMLLLTKTIKIPHVEEARQKEVISFEAEKSIPYPIKEVSWDYQIMSDDGVETEIFLSSMKADAADEFCSALADAGVVPEAIESGSILDYNTWKYCGLPPDVVILNVGARFTNILIARDDGIFVRGIPVGGNTLTQVIADSSGKSFEDSEEDKLGFFSKNGGGGSGAEPFKSSAEAVMKRLGDELKRSILNYRRMGRVNAPNKIHLAGGASLLPGLAEYLAETQKMSVDYLEATSGLAVSPRVDQTLLADNTIRLSEVIGEAARLVLPQSMGINLLPKHIVDEAVFARKRPYVLAGAALLAASVVPPFLFLKKSADGLREQTAAFDGRIPALRQRAEDLVRYGGDAKAVEVKIAGLEGLAMSKANWINLFIDLENRLMEQKDVWLENLKVVRSGSGASQKYNLELTGGMLIRDVGADTYDPEKVTERITNLLASFKSSAFIKDYENVKTDPSNPRIVKFDFTLVVNPDKPI